MRQKHGLKNLSLIIPALLLLILSSCERKPVYLVSEKDYPEFSDDLGYERLEEGIEKSLVYLRRIPGDRQFFFGEDGFSAEKIILSLTVFQDFIRTRPDASAMKRFIKTRYLVYRSGGGESGKVLFTGYYEPITAGSREPSAAFGFPVYGPPEDIITADLSLFSDELAGKKITGRVLGKSFLPYHDRAEIDRGILAGKAKPLAYLADPVDLFFLQVQGSGRVDLDDGETLYLNYHSQNGRPYKSIGKLLIETGKIPSEKMSMQAIREYLSNHPEDMDKVLHHNPSYVFFQLRKDGPYGALNVRLTPERSIAVDRTVFPMSALAFIRTMKPETDDAGRIIKWEPFSRFVLNQDTGGAIKGPGRADLFWGAGEKAAMAAGHQQHEGDLFLLVLR